MDTWVLGVSIYHNQPVVAHKVDSMVNVDTAPWLLRHHPEVVGWLRWLVLMFGTGHTSSACIFYLAVDVRPIHC